LPTSTQSAHSTATRMIRRKLQVCDSRHIEQIARLYQRRDLIFVPVLPRERSQRITKIDSAPTSRTLAPEGAILFAI
jgi:hypothetical protein